MPSWRTYRGPHPLTFYVKGQMLAGMQQGLTTMLSDEAKYEVTAFNGPVAWTTINREGTAFLIYPSGYYRPWMPVLSQAPSGTTRALWAASTNFTSPIPAYDDGSSWRSTPPVAGNTLISIAAGVDGSVFGLSGSGLERFDPTTSRWSLVAAATSSAVQVAVGDAGHVWLRTPQRKVLRHNGNG